MIKILSKFIHRYSIFNPILRIIFPYFFDIQSVNTLKRDTQIIVSLSCGEESFNTVEYTLYSIFNQKVSPDNVVLWISNKYELSDLPYSITKFVKEGLSIRFVEDKKSYTKIYYALKEYKNSIIVTADENIYYPKDWLSKLYLSYITSPEDIHAHNVTKINYDGHKILPYSDWKKHSNPETASFNYFPIESGGILYPPECFLRDVLREDIYKKKINTSWDIWSWCLALASGRKIRLVKNHIKRLKSTNIITSFLKYKNLLQQYDKADKKITQICEYYGKNIFPKLSTK